VVSMVGDILLFEIHTSHFFLAPHSVSFPEWLQRKVFGIGHWEPVKYWWPLQNGLPYHISTTVIPSALLSPLPDKLDRSKFQCPA
jgi:hypothetical protein